VLGILTAAYTRERISLLTAPPYQRTLLPRCCSHHPASPIALSRQHQVMEARLLNRGKSSGRSDDTAEVIKKRFQVRV
jgi:adenylate kinase family enzyme